MKRLVLALALCAPLVVAAESDLIAGGDAERGKSLAATCAACHGSNGVSGNPEWPSLAQQGTRYTYEQLKAFKGGDRKNALMSAQAAGLSEQDMRDLAAYYAGLAYKPGIASEDAVTIAEPLYRAGDLERNIPACAGCHAPNGVGNPAAGYPMVAGQHATYASQRLKTYRDGEVNTASAKIMAAVAAQLTDEEIAALASYLNGLQVK